METFMAGAAVSGDFPGVGDSGGADGGVGDARDVLVDAGCGTAGGGAG